MKVNLKHAYRIGLCALSILVFQSCGDDHDWKDVDGASPEFALQTDHIMTEAGRQIKIAGKVSDKDGIASISMLCHEINLNKTIDLIEIYGEPLTSYDLDYSFALKSIEDCESYDVDITVTDIGGRLTTKTLLVTLDGDFSAPFFSAAPDKEITVLIKEKTAFNLKFTAEDNKAIDYVLVDVAGVDGFPIKIEGNSQNKLDFARKLELPGKEATYNVSITAYDKAAQDGEIRSSSINSTVKVSELPDFERVYLADVATAAELNNDVFGVPMLIEHVGEYRYQARYYNEKAGTEICFIPQKTDFAPICFGPDPENNGRLGDDPETVGRITLDKAGVYYLIDLNTLTGEYSMETYSVDEAIDPVMTLHYGQNDLNTWNTDPNGAEEPWWQEWYIGPITSGPGDVMRMEQDRNNKHIFILENWKLNAGEQMHIVIHNWHSHGWWNFTTWRCDNATDPDKFMYYGDRIKDTPHYGNNDEWFKYKYGETVGFDINKWSDEGYRKTFVPDNWCEATIQTSGYYKLVFDAHLERAKLIRTK